MASARNSADYRGWVVGIVDPFLGVLHSKPTGLHSTGSPPILRLDTVHRRVLHLLGPASENCYLALQQTAEWRLLHRVTGCRMPQRSDGATRPVSSCCQGRRSPARRGFGLS